MPTYLATLAIGPVQGFIAAARRSRDLWFGSYLLSEASKAAALRLASESGTILIFPHADLADLQPDTPLQVANKILAQVETDDPAALVEAAKQAARHIWRLHARGVVQAIRSSRGNPLRKKLWRAQSRDIFEFYAAWVPLANPAQYRDQRQRLEALLAARKNSRDFFPSDADPAEARGQHKSSLDGLRESVLDSRNFTPNLRRRWGINDTEELDCPGLVKRVGSLLSLKFERFTPLSRIAVDPWIRGLARTGGGPECLTALNETLNILVPQGLASRVKGNEEQYRDLPYDGQLLYPFRLETAQAEYRNQPEGQAVLTILNAQLQPVWQAFQEPQPYLAILTADGDRMGESLEKIRELSTHQAISTVLSSFARWVPEEVRRHCGHCIYAGGDELLALLPLDQAIACAAALATAFHERVQEVFNSLPPAEHPEVLPTLSVGVTINHFLEPLGSVLQRARRAEKLAKGDDQENPRNALAVILKPRSGAEIAVRRRWEGSPEIDFEKWVRAFQHNTLPDRTPYLLRQAAPTLTWLQERGDNIFAGELTRLLRRRRVNDPASELTTLRPITDEVPLLNALHDRAALTDEGGIQGLIDELLIARVIAKAARQTAGGVDPPGAADPRPGVTDA